MLRLAGGFLVACLFVLAGCVGQNGGSPGCVSGSTQACTCADGQASEQSCGATLTWGACACDGGVPPADLGRDASNDLGVRPDTGAAPTDTGADPGRDVPTPGAGTFGARCAGSADCASRLCLPTGRCSRACTSRGDCPAGSNWACTGLPGTGPVCTCTVQDATERCNGVDDDCDGLVDNGAACATGVCREGRCVCPPEASCGGRCVDIARDPANCGGCGISCGGGTACAGGACVCPASTPTACGARCVDTRSDRAHCGGCGRACAAGQSCAEGRCVTTVGTCPAFCTAHADCDPCRSPSDPPDNNYCCASGVCVYVARACGTTTVDAGRMDSGTDASFNFDAFTLDLPFSWDLPFPFPLDGF